jgi:DNA invertase Pin-like site-specific DNA recombinase
MSTSNLITTAHRERKAIIYIRQSSLHQTISHQESLRLQYALQQRAIELGWIPESVEVIDTDLGMTGAAADEREGFKDLVAQVTLGQVGIILSFDVTRLSRNCSDWYPLLDICGWRNCLIGDNDGIYDPATPNGRLLLGIKGQLSELELHTIRARMQTGLLNKAKRGELALGLPIGLVRNEIGQVVKIPDLEVQQRLELVFDTFLRLRTAHQVVGYFHKNDLRIPGCDRFGDTIWKKPTSSAVLGILKNPAYAGAFVYGRTQTIRDAAGKKQLKRLPKEQWLVCIQDKYPAYITWETFEEIQEMLKNNYAIYDKDNAPGTPRSGDALLHGLVYCGKCSHQMRVHYKTGYAYLCNRLRIRYHTAKDCQRVSGASIDDFVVRAFFKVLSPAELDAYDCAVAAQKEAVDKVDQAHEQQLERLRYQVALAERQFNRVDPDNRLVARELEKRWETALRDLKQAEEAFAQRQRELGSLPKIPPELKEMFTSIGQNLPALWQQGVLTPENKKALLRCLIDKVVLNRDQPDRVLVRIVWRGGDATSLVVPTPVGAMADLSTAAEMENLIVELSQQGKGDEEIAQHLTAMGYRSPSCIHKVLPHTVSVIRRRHRIFHEPSGQRPVQITGFLTVRQIADSLGIFPQWIHYRIKTGRIQVTKDVETGFYLFPDTPETLAQFHRLHAGECDHLYFSQRPNAAESKKNVG